MFNNYLVTTPNKLFLRTNIVGLAVCILIALYVQGKLFYDWDLWGY